MLGELNVESSPSRQYKVVSSKNTMNDPESTETNHLNSEHEHDAHEHALNHPGHAHKHQKGPLGFLISLFSHSHSDEVEFNSPIVTSGEGIRALEISLIGLGITALVQIWVVALSGSVALLTDSIHNFADALTAIPLGIAFILGKRKPNARYTYGYGRAEDLAGIFIVAIISASSIFALYEAVRKLIHPESMSNIPLVIFAGIIGFIGNELVSIYRIRVGRKIGSAALTADGLHARSDGLISLAVVLGAVGVELGVKISDPIASLLIGVAVFTTLRQAVKEIYRRLMDSIDPAMVDTVTQILLTTPGIESVDTVRIRWVGHDLRAEVDVLSDSNLSLIESHKISEEAHHNLLHQLPRLSEAVIHTSPLFPTGDQTKDAHQNIAHHFPLDE